MKDIFSMLETAPSQIPYSKTCRRNLIRLVQTVDPDLDLSKEVLFMDISQSEKFGDKVLHNICPTLTRARAGQGGFFIYNLQRMMTTGEMLAVQGFPKKRFQRQGLMTDANRQVSERQFRMMIGNSMAVPVLGRLVHRLLLVTGAIPDGTPDPWDTHKKNAQKK